jgi:CheY-like chemotaxis protein
MADHMHIMVAEDDENDVLLLLRALKKIGMGDSVNVCRDGVDAIEYLQGRGQYDDRQRHPFPNVIITDLKMPRKGGMEVLRWLREHPECHVIPLIVLSSSNQYRDVSDAYREGANCYLKKPSSFEELQHLMKALFDFWSLCEKPEVPEVC